MADSAKEPLQSDEGKGASLRFPAAKSAASRTEGAFNSDKGSLFSYLTRRDDFEPPIPGPPRADHRPKWGCFLACPKSATLTLAVNTNICTSPEDRARALEQEWIGRLPAPACVANRS